MDWSTVQLPIFRSKKGSNFKDWVSSWTAYLISKIKKKSSSNIFTPCILLLKVGFIYDLILVSFINYFNLIKYYLTKYSMTAIWVYLCCRMR